MALLGIAAIGFLFLMVFGKNATASALKAIGVVALLVFGLMIASIIHAQNQPPTWITATAPLPGGDTYYAAHHGSATPPGNAPAGYHFNFYGRIVPDDDHGATAR